MRVATRTTAWAGIDIGKTHHWICAVDADGRALVSVKVANVEADIVAALATVTDLADQVLEDRSRGAAAVAEGRATQEPDPEHDQHLRTSGRGRRPGRARPLGISMMLSSRSSVAGRVDAEGAIVS